MIDTSSQSLAYWKIAQFCLGKKKKKHGIVRQYLPFLFKQFPNHEMAEKETWRLLSTVIRTDPLLSCFFVFQIYVTEK